MNQKESEVRPTDADADGYMINLFPGVDIQKSIAIARDHNAKLEESKEAVNGSNS
jgi:hypothetical protein